MDAQVRTNAPISKDVQSEIDLRRIMINEVGIHDIRYPIRVAVPQSADTKEYQDSIAHFRMVVALPAERKGTHMSRFIEVLERYREKTLDNAMLRELFSHMLTTLDAQAGSIEMSFPFFVEKAAPVSQVKSLMDYEGGYRIEKLVGQSTTVLTMWVKAMATSLCPCSKAISDYGAHNQRSSMIVKVTGEDSLGLKDLITVAEEESSCQVYGILKRPDEKYVTEYAYDNPKFVEDLVRDMAGRLQKDKRIKTFEVSAENFESIHNHSAYARVIR